VIEVERWPGAGDVRLALAKHERAEVETILVDQTEAGEARRQGGSRDVDLTRGVLLQTAHERVDLLPDACGVRADDFSVRETTHFGCARHTC
jgi:hypothetical protein